LHFVAILKVFYIYQIHLGVLLFYH
jgi:hypothetical protein